MNPSAQAAAMPDRPVEPALEARGIAKRYGETIALRDAGLRLLRGQVHALMGENGAGKSTLVKVLSGALAADAGELRLGGRALRLDSVQQAVSQGVIAVHQHLSLFPHLSALENLSAFQLGMGWTQWSRRQLMSVDRAVELMRTVGLDIAPQIRVSELSLGQRHLLEVARALAQRCTVLILDEPTAALSPVESARLFEAVARIKARGVAILLITHKLDEIEAHADAVTVLRDGTVALDAVAPAACTRADLVRAMLGHQEEEGRAPEADRSGHDAVRLAIDALCVRAGDAPVSFTVRSGEIVGLTGLLGSGALELAESVAGARAYARGRIVLDGQPIAPAARARADRLGLAFVPADRTSDGLFLDQPAWVNAAVRVLDSSARLGLCRERQERASAKPWLDALRLYPQDDTRPAAAFSGGNQQKLLIARALACSRTRALLVLEPTRGVDVGARALIHTALRDAAHRGVSVLIASTDLDEVAAVCDRALVVAAGQIRGEVSHPTRQALSDALALAAQEP